LKGKQIKAVGAGCKNGGFYLLRVSDGEVLNHTPIYTGPPMDNPKVDPRTLALPSTIGGLQTGCATDGKSFFTNGIDCIFKVRHPTRRLEPPTGGRVTSVAIDLTTEKWRHERPLVTWVGGTRENPLFRNTGDPVASGIALANGVGYFTTFSSNKLVAVDLKNGKSLKEIYLGPVLAGPSVSRGAFISEPVIPILRTVQRRLIFQRIRTVQFIPLVCLFKMKSTGWERAKNKSPSTNK
jgi:hypothetical protein